MVDIFKWYCLSVTLKNGAPLSPGLQEAVSSLLIDLGSPGVQLTATSVISYFSSRAHIEKAKRLAEEMLHNLSENLPLLFQCEISEVQPQNWESNWRDFYAPLRITPRFTVVRPWEKYRPEDGEIVLVIRPEQAFGTGLHESTRLLINLIEKYMKPGLSFLDVGIGTGIAAIVAAKLKARSVMGVDIDSEAVKSARWHAHKNGVSEVIRVKKADILKLKDGQYDIVGVNIEWKVLSGIVDRFPRYLSERGKLLLSGILGSEVRFLQDSLIKNGMIVAEIMHMGEWAAIAAQQKI